MARSNDDVVRFVQLIHSEHKDYWKNKSGELKRYRDAYECKFWESERYDPTMIRIETADAFAYVESFMSSLFGKNNSVVIGPDHAASTGDAAAAQVVANRFLYDQRLPMENASRLALIYDYSAVKLCPRESNNFLDRVSIQGLPPWEVIVDRDAGDVDEQRFVGHTYYMTVVEAREKWGNKRFTAIPKEDYFSDYSSSAYEEHYSDLPDDYLYIELVELYDLLYDEVYYWSPNWSNGEKLLSRDPIPLRTYDDHPLPNISLLYYSRCPSKPMEGYSALSRVYDQVYEKNILRTYWANAVRRDSRQYLYREGVVDEEALAKITAGIDGAMIPVDTQDGLGSIIVPVGVEPISSNFDRYNAVVEADLNRGSIMAPFSRGEATRATATEITALATYTASEVGKLARERDGMIENITLIYLRLISLLCEEGESVVLDVKGSAKVLTADSLDSKFTINALDQGSTPLSDALKKQNLLNLLPTLQGLGVDARKMLEEIVRAYELPKDFLEIAQQVASAPSPSAADISQMEMGVGTQQSEAELLAQSLRPGATLER